MERGLCELFYEELLQRKELKFMNRNRKRVKLAAVVMASALTAAMPVSAAGSGYEAKIEGTMTTNFIKYVLQDKNAVIPDLDFSYEITAGAAKAYNVGDKKFEVLAGVDADRVTMAGVDTETAKHIHFDSEDDTKNDENPLVKGYETENSVYIEKEAALDFSNVRFTEPGIYRYIITESGTNRSVKNDSDMTRVLDVYVYDATEGDNVKKLKISGYVLHSSEDDSPEIAMGDNNGSAGSYTETKGQGFTNEYQTVDLTFRKEVSGNQASKDKYFKFTATLTSGIPNDVVNVDIAGADGTLLSNTATLDAYKNEKNPTQLTFDGSGKATGTFYLQHGQQIVIQGLPADVAYDITEAAEDYKSEPAEVQGYTDPVNGNTARKDIKTSYLNRREGTIPTGVATAVAPFAVLTAAAGAGILIVTRKRHAE